MKIICTKCMTEIPTMQSHERGAWWIEPHLCKGDSASTNNARDKIGAIEKRLTDKV